MGTQLDVFPLQEPIRTQQDIISSWLDLDDSYTPIFQQELQDLENHLFHFENDPISSTSSSSSLPIPAADDPSFMFDLYNDFNADQQAGPEHNDQAVYQPILPVVLPVEQQCVEPDVCDTFLNDYDFGLLSPTDLSPDINNINDQFCDNTTISGFMNQLAGDVEMPEEPMVVNTANTRSSDSNKTTDDDDNDNEEGTNEEGTDEDRPKPGTLNCKNLVSERNRRKRLSQQLLSLRAIVPNITKMDKRSVLVDALSYLRNIHEETEKLQKEMKEQQPRPKLSDLRESSQDNPSGTLRIPRSISTSAALPKPIAQITEIDTEKIEDKRFVVKITCKGGNGVGSDVLRVFESLDFEITYTALQQLQPQEFLVTIFVRVRKQGKMTEQKLKDCITSMALRTGLTLQNP